MTSQHRTEDVQTDINRKPRMARSIISDEKLIKENETLTNFKRFHKQDLQQNDTQQPVNSNKNVENQESVKNEKRSFGYGRRTGNVPYCYSVPEKKYETICYDTNGCIEVSYTEVVYYCEVV